MFDNDVITEACRRYLDGDPVEESDAVKQAMWDYEYGLGGYR